MSDAIESAEQAIVANRNGHKAAATTIANDKTLTPEAKAGKLRDLDQAARDSHERLLAQRNEAVAATRDQMYRRAFQTGVGELSGYRPLYTQAAAATSPKELQKLQQQADRTGDVLLQKACWQVAFDNDWTHLLADAPDAVKALLEYEYSQDLRRAVGPARQQQLQRAFADRVRTTGPVLR